MPAYTIVTTSAAQGSDAAEMNTLTDDFGSEAEAVGYSRRMADEMLGLAAQLSLDFDYSNVALYDGDLLDEDLDPDHPALIGVWVLDEDGAAFVPADEFRDVVTETA
ncbi:hypothetical protein JKL49_18445 [Phenylobacterium sp. 20VBR1]|uniref:Uncharacterized protein n=2 Tax=Phenylobacterium glaciei TaxID=2803784 RepID=A0A941HWW8_9CAUL|nr:hypothetical protein [Phenylobacterium glaciei]MBR7621379.1 hypothetical protein [Phenylobacterium glaciei]